MNERIEIEQVNSNDYMEDMISVEAAKRAMVLIIMTLVTYLGFQMRRLPAGTVLYLNG